MKSASAKIKRQSYSLPCAVGRYRCLNDDSLPMKTKDLILSVIDV